MTCLIRMYNQQQGRTVKLYIHHLCLQLNEPSPYEHEFETKNRCEYKPIKNKESWVGNFKW